MAYRVETHKGDMMNTANKITCIRIGLTVLLIVVYCLTFIPNATSSWIPNITIGKFNLGFTWVDAICFVLFIVASATDGVDGHIARSRNQVSDLGKFLDPFADKFLVDSTLILLSTKMVASHHLVLPFLTIIIVARDLAIDGLRMVSALKGKALAANKWGKAKTAVQMGFIPIIILNGFPFSLLPDSNSWLENRCSYVNIFTNIIVAVMVVFALLSLVIYFKQNKYLFKGESNNEN